MPVPRKVPQKSMYLLRNPIKAYAWGSTTLMARFMGHAPTGAPEAEMWMGTHPGGPSTLTRGAQEEALTVRRQAEGHASGELPFLLKLLAAGQPLSLQAHPNPQQALEGYGRENAAGIPLSAPERCYKDPHAKPELIVALTPFEALSGFRTMSDIYASLANTSVEYIDSSVVLAAAAGDGAGQRLLFTTWMADRAGSLADALRDFLPCAEHVLAPATFAWWSAAAQTFPGDATVLVALLLEHLCLKPGEGVFLPAGNLHAYLSGLGIEIMGPSDNVLRGGMTPKHVDVGELCRVLRFEPYKPNVLTAIASAAAPVSWPTPEAPFCLATESVRYAREWVPNRVDEIVLCTGGAPVFDDNLVLAPGHALYVSRQAPPARVSGEGSWVRASSNQALWSAKEGIS